MKRMDFCADIQCIVIHSDVFLEKVRALENCFSKIPFLLKSKASSQKVIAISAFTNCSDNSSYSDLNVALFYCIQTNFDYPVTASLIAQAPASGSVFSLELTILPTSDSYSISYKQSTNTYYTIIQFLDRKLVIAYGLRGNGGSTSVLQQNIDAFEQMKTILINEELDFSHVLRQWNYIEDITGFENENGIYNQHYQIFNDVRTLFYASNDFLNGYPAATGIGTSAGGLVIDFIASTKLSDVYALKSPIQFDAHVYTDEVLANNDLVRGVVKSTPKFERGKFVQFNNSALLFVSGTAAIVGQETVQGVDTEAQTKLTLENILELVSLSNLEQHNITVSRNKIVCKYLRAYVKYPEDVVAVTQMCNNYFADIVLNVVVSDVCRDNLLVEIEGVFFI